MGEREQGKLKKHELPAVQLPNLSPLFIYTATGVHVLWKPSIIASGQDHRELERSPDYHVHRP